MEPKHIRIHKAIAEKIKIVNYAHQNLIHIATDKYGVETKFIITKILVETASDKWRQLMSLSGGKI